MAKMSHSTQLKATRLWQEQGKLRTGREAAAQNEELHEKSKHVVELSPEDVRKCRRSLPVVVLRIRVNTGELPLP